MILVIVNLVVITKDSGEQRSWFILLVRERFEEAAREGEAAVLVTSAGIRPFVRSIFERFRAQTPVMSQAEIHPRVRLKTVGSV